MDMLLQSLSSQIRSESTENALHLAQQTSKAELSLLFGLITLSLTALSHRTDANVGEMSSGQIRDLIDTVLFEIKDLKILREQTEREFLAFIHDRNDEVMRLLESEQNALNALKEFESTQSVLTIRALKTIFNDIHKKLTNALEEADNTRNIEQIKNIGTETVDTIQAATGQWLDYQKQLSCVQPVIPPVTIPAKLATDMTRNAMLNKLVSSLRHCMKLRRQQIRMDAIASRMHTVHELLDMLDRLREHISM
jgi:hypothetical protein